ncbi:MAG: hypothetical protein WCA24_12735 [Thiomonas sp.]
MPPPLTQAEPRFIAVQTGSVGPWRVAVPASAARSALAADTPLWTGPDGRLLLLHDDVAVPALDLPACWNLPQAAKPAAGAALLLQTLSDDPPFALRLDSIGDQHELLFWPVPRAVRRVSGVQAAALTGVPWQPESEQAVLLLDLPWLMQRLRAEVVE